MKKYFYLFAALSIFLGFSVFASAASIFDITYPIEELGGCASQQECKTYCDDLSNKDSCLAFAEKNGFISKEKVDQAKKMPAFGPGGCKSADECRTYCDDQDNEDECLGFAEKYGLKAQVPRGEEVSARAKLIKEQGGPGNCQSRKECRAYCDNPSNQNECLEFAEKNNLMDKKEIKAAKKVLAEGGPGGCKTEKECKAFCDKPDNLEACLAFAEEHDLIDKDEASRARQMAGKPGPGGCVGAVCKEYCDGPDHFEECIKFAEENNLMPKEELEKAKRLGNKPGPGGCRGRQQCDAFCGKPENQEICFQFAVENNLILPEGIERAKKMKSAMEQGGPGGCKNERECRAYCENPDSFEICGEFAKKNGLMGEEEMKMMDRGREMAKKAREVGGPGGCKGDTECRAYCGKSENVEECLAFAVEQGGVNLDEAKGMLEKFARAGMEGPREHFRPMEGRPQQAGLSDQAGEMRPPQGMMPPMPPQFQQQFEQRFQKFEQFRELEGQFRKPPEMMENFQGPGGCQTPEQCIKYCSDSANRTECAKLNPSVGAPPPGEIFRQVEPGSERGFGGGGGTTTPLGVKPPIGEPSQGSLPPIGAEGSVCPREFHPVCGTNNRTYPNKCFADKDNVSVAKEGPCGEGLGFNMDGSVPQQPPSQPYPVEPTACGPQPPVALATGCSLVCKDARWHMICPDGAQSIQYQQYPSIYPSPDQFQQYQQYQQPPQYIPQYTQPPVQPEQPTAPQSRRFGGSLLSSLLQAFSNALRMK